MAATVGDVFSPGDKVEASGIYTVIHDRKHHESHDVTCVYGKHFPPCAGCSKHVRFRLKRAATHIDNHKQF